MFSIIVTEKGGEQRRLEFDKSEVTIGRVQGNDVILPKGNVSKRHARIVLKDGKFIIVDLKSTNGTYVNGRKITSPLVVKESDKVYIGDFILGVQDAAVAAEPAGGGYPRPDGPPSGSAQRPSVPRPPPPVGPPPMPPPSAPEPPAAVSHAPPPPVASPMSSPAPAPDHSAHARPRVPAPSAPAAPAPSPSPGPAAPAPSAPVAPPSPNLGPPAASPPPAAPPPSAKPAEVKPAPRPMPRELGRGVEVAPLPEAMKQQLGLQNAILERLIPRLDLDNLAPEKFGSEELEQEARSAVVDLVESMSSSGDIPAGVDQDRLVDDVVREAIGLGPLEGLLADNGLEEIVIDRPDRIIVRRNGKQSGSGAAFSSERSFLRAVERLVAPTGHRIGESSPLVDVRLRDGVHLSAAVPPVSVRGVCLTLRKPRQRTQSIADLITGAALSQSMSSFLATCVAARRNVLVCGAPGSDKNTVVAALASMSPPGERIVSVEEVAELALGRDSWIALEARPGDGNGVPAVGLDMVLRSALRMGADRLVVGGVHGAEAFELVSAMAASTDGAVISAAGDGARAALTRLTALAGLGAPGASTDALRGLVSCAVDVVVHVARYADGVVRLTSIDEVAGVRDGGFDIRPIFTYGGERGFAAAGQTPGFYDDIAALGIPTDPSIFRS